MAVRSLSSPLLHFLLSIILYLLTVSSLFFYSTRETTILKFKGVSLDTPILHFAISPENGFACERIRVAGASLLDLPRYANSRRVTVTVSGAAGRRFQGKVEICTHRVPSVRFCQCEKDECQSLRKGEWTAEFSPYRNIFIDARFEGDELGTVTVSLEEGLQEWRLVCLLIVCILHFYAPLVSSWALFYYTSLMALGVLLLVIFSLHQGIKLMSMGNKSFIYILLFGSLASVATFSVHFFTRLAKSILVNFGIRAEIHISVVESFLVISVLAGAGLGYWIVRKCVVSEDGRVKTGVARTVRWTMRYIALVFVCQSTLETLLGWVVWCTSWFICSLITSTKWRTPTIKHHADTDVMNEVDISPNANLKGPPRKRQRTSNVTSPARPSRYVYHAIIRRVWPDGMLRC